MLSRGGLYYERGGEGEPLVLIMGMSANHLAWGDPFRREISPGFDCVVFDNRGMGRSEDAQLPFTVADMAADTLALMDELGIDSAHVLGVSMGGAIAQEIALTAPERLRTLTLGATFCGGPKAKLMAAADLRMLGDAYASGEREPVFRAMWEINASPDFRSDESRFAEFVAMGEALPVPRPVVMQQLQACAEHDTSARLHEITVPTLVIHGTADRLVDRVNGETIAESIPAPLELMEDVGHIFWWEQPERAAELVRSHALAAA